MCNDRIWILLTRKLSGEATHTELEELQLLINAHPQGAATVEQLTAVWNSSPKHDSDFMEATYLAHLERMKDYGVHINADADLQTSPDNDVAINNDKKQWFTPKRLALLVLASTFLAAGWFALSPRMVSAKEDTAKKFSEVKTTKGARSKMKLPDGSDVWLNAGSKLNYNKDFETGEREVYLTGEAFFDVVKDVKRPFIIHTSAIDIKVLGTQFNVKAYDEDETTETSLIRGSVEVFLRKYPAQKYVLKPSQKLVLMNKGALALDKKTVKEEQRIEADLPARVELKELSYLQGADSDVETSWTRNILSFDDELFTEVARKMERWYNVSIRFQNKKWEREYLSGSFENESLEQALKALKFTTSFNYNITGNSIVIY